MSEVGYGKPPIESQFKPGVSPNPKGRPKGIRNWSIIVRQLLADENFAQKILDKKPGWWESLPNKNLGQAIAAAMMQLALMGDSKAAEWLRKTGYGDKLDITSGDKPIQPIAIYDLRRDGNNESGTDDNETDSQHETESIDAGGEEPQV